MKILLTGGSGRLGSMLTQMRFFDYVPTRKEMDISDYKSVDKYTKNLDIDLIVHAAAIPNTLDTQETMNSLYEVNIIGTYNLLGIAPILFISSEYVFDGKKGMYTETDSVNPLNFYGYTKALGENMMIKNNHNNKILRCGRMSLNPWPYKYACDDMFTSGDYLDVMANEIDIAIELYEILPHILHIGTERKSVLDLALQTNLNVKHISRNSLPNALPEDCSLDVTLWNSIKQNLLD